MRLLVVLPSWLGDVVMATPALRLLRNELPGAFIGGLARPGIDELLAGTQLLDELHVDRARGVMGPKLVAAKIRPRAYDAALLLTNSFSSALITRLAFIPKRVGYDRDARGLLLTHRLPARRKGPMGAGGFVCESAVTYYLRAARALIEALDRPSSVASDPPLELGLTPEQDQHALQVLSRAGVSSDTPNYVVFNPGANNPLKRWPAERFGELAAWLVQTFDTRVLVSGSPNEAELCTLVRDSARRALEDARRDRVMSLTELGITIGSLKGVIARSRLLVTNDTGPRHIAAAMGVPVVTLFGPTDPRWTTLPPGNSRCANIVADPALPESEIADDHPERCRIDRIELIRVQAACRELLDLT